jgi:hypothetical protein
MTDGYKYIDVFYHLQAIPSLKVELEISSITGKVMFSTLFYSDEQHTVYIGESTNQEVVLGANVFQTGFLQSGNIPLYAIGRIKLLQRSQIGISSIKINDVSHIEAGSLTIDTPSMQFILTNSINSVYQSSKLGLITDPNYQIELEVQQMVGAVGIEYLYYNDAAYTQLYSIQTSSLVLGNNIFQVETVNKYVLLRFKLVHVGHLALSSFKLHQIEQDITSISTLEYIPEVSVVSETCFPANTMVKTDQGLIAIQKIKPHHHTIQGKSIIAITSTYSSDKELVSIKKDSIRKNYPSKDTFISKKHKIYMKGKLKAAYRLVDQYKGITLVPYQGQMLFNILLEDYGIMNIHGLLCETLHPMNPMANLFRKLYRNDLGNDLGNKIESRESFLIQ